MRVVLRGNALVLDEQQALPGRGGYVHRSVDCASKMAQPGRWERALRAASGSVDAAEVRRVTQAFLQQLSGGEGESPTVVASKPRGRFGLGR